MVSGHPLPRVGQIEFLNCLPLAWGLAQQDLSDVMTLVSDTPDVLSDSLIAGHLDVGPISLVEALNHLDEIVLLPEVAVGSDGPVQSSSNRRPHYCCNLIRYLPSACSPCTRTGSILLK